MIEKHFLDYKKSGGGEAKSFIQLKQSSLVEIPD